MRIAQIAPLAESVPPKFYGGTERIVSYLTEELVRQGNEVTLFASGDSQTRAELVPCCPQALRMDASVRDMVPHLLVMLENVRRRADEFDVLHFHMDMLQFPVFRERSARTVTTLHGRLDLHDLQPFYRKFPDFPLVSISAAQRLPMPPVNWVGTVHHGLPPGLLPFNPAPRQNYLAFLGRISPEKRPDRAIEIAQRARVPLRIAAKVDNADRQYFEQRIQGLLADPLIDFIGEIGDTQKADFLGNARALLFPIDWPEPFGLVLIEAMACGTPVIAYPNGAVTEIIEDGVTGFLVRNIEEAADAVARLPQLDRQQIRRRFEERFGVARMADDYLRIYAELARPSAPLSRAA
jgi:glycosyltransferase involved in cell wall biosynthesis